MVHHHKIVQIVALTALFTCIPRSTIHAQTPRTKHTQVLKVKDFYINRTSANAKNVMRAVRFIHAGVIIRSISLLGGPYTLAGVILGDLIIGLALLVYGQKMINTFIATKRLRVILQDPKIARKMSKEGWNIFNSGKAVFRGPIINAMHRQTEVNNAIQQEVALIAQAYPELAQEKRIQALTQFFTWTTEIKTYQEARKKKQAILQKKTKSPLIKKGIKLIDKLITAPSVKKSIEQRKNAIQNLFKTYPTFNKAKWFLSFIADTLFRQVQEIRKKHSRRFSLFKRKKS